MRAIPSVRVTTLPSVRVSVRISKVSIRSRMSSLISVALSFIAYYLLHG